MRRDGPSMYHVLAPWWHLLSPPSHYAQDAATLKRLLTDDGIRPVRTVLELGSGGGNNASHLKHDFVLTLVDLSPEMLAESRKLNPECDHTMGDMRTIRLGRTFDSVFIHDAIMYMTTEEDLRAAMETAFVHCAPEGVAVFVPDVTQESFGETTRSGGSDGPNRSIRYLEWVHDPDPTDTAYEVDFAYLLREGQGTTQVLQDHHVMGVFPRSTWTKLLTQVGFEPHSAVDEHGHEAFVGRKPEGAIYE